MQNPDIDCRYIGRCGGCSWGHLTHVEQLRRKLETVQDKFPSATIHYSPKTGVRDRVDLIWQKTDAGMALGLYSVEGNDIVDLESCAMLSPALAAWFTEFRQVAPPIQKGSVRLRVAPDGARGVWLDFANWDVKTLFEERHYLKFLSERAFVEIGQRRKALHWVDGQPKLLDPELKPWFETYDSAGGAIPLYGPVGGFSQVGFAANRALVEEVTQMAAFSGEKKWLELFSGNGNFAMALGSRGYQVDAVEVEGLAIDGLHRSMAEVSEPWRRNVKVSRLDVYLKTAQLPDVRECGVLVDPPRAGLRQVLRHMGSGWLPRSLIYVSCFAESFLQDAESLSILGYKSERVFGVDQFPFSPHSEWVALFVKS